MSTHRPPTVFEVIADLWNSSEFNPVAPSLDCHFDFQTATPCLYDLVTGMTPATPQKIEDSLTSMGAKILRIVGRWEQSGQGKGGTAEEQELDKLPDHVDFGSAREENGDDNSNTASSLANNEQPLSSSSSPSSHDRFGGLSGRSACALQSRSAFLNGEPSYLLLFWEVIDSHQLLRSSWQRLNNEVADGTSLTTTTNDSDSNSIGRHRVADYTTESSMYDPLAKLLKDLADSHVQLAMQREEDQNHEERMEDRRQQSDTRAELRKRSFQRRAELLDQARQYRRLNAELNPHNENSQRLSNFYMEECRILQQEIDTLDNSNNNR